ncbi:tetratricopeptide repeat protein [Tatumella saanichensis]|uniref:tetratricopeptide repeat protein n=1 Tax=Tatumella saanichensis TaxID=480813 RepID=UPI0004B7587C|nr:tetratricopeptide repeat protein [Tatumella saanichensis]
MAGKGESIVLLIVLLGSGCQSVVPVAGGETRLTLGLEYLAMGEYRAAERNLLRAKRALPGDYRPVLALARLNQTEGHVSRAIVWYTQAEEMAPENGYVLNNYGAFLCALGQYDEARRRFTLAGQSLEPGGLTDTEPFSATCFPHE